MFASWFNLHFSLNAFKSQQNLKIIKLLKTCNIISSNFTDRARDGYERYAERYDNNEHGLYGARLGDHPTSTQIDEHTEYVEYYGGKHAVPSAEQNAFVGEKEIRAQPRHWLVRAVVEFFLFFVENLILVVVLINLDLSMARRKSSRLRANEASLDH